MGNLLFLQGINIYLGIEGLHLLFGDKAFQLTQHLLQPRILLQYILKDNGSGIVRRENLLIIFQNNQMMNLDLCIRRLLQYYSQTLAE